ncbi:MAG: glycosyltransferase family 2 protein [Acidiferrobacterales bacterium]|nr:glycosyltransferase family 2 protein [Acidiferrobacterales bacterium]
MIKTLESVTAQTQLPSLWVIVDDGSRDSTPKILREWSERFDFIRVVTLKDRGRRQVGPGVIEAFYAGYDQIDPSEFSYICKLDLDLELPEKYFETLIDKMSDDPRLGTCSGKPYMRIGDKLVSEKCGDENSVGMTKMYRRVCFEEIGGFVKEVMWDGIDGHRCRMLGWKAASYDEDKIRFIHLRPMGSSYKGILTGRMRHGFGQYFMGTSFLYIFVSSVYRMFHPPWIVGGAAMLLGYLRSMLAGVPRYGDSEFRRFLRKYQWRCLLQGKTKATRLLNDEQEAVWQSRCG